MSRTWGFFAPILVDHISYFYFHFNDNKNIPSFGLWKDYSFIVIPIGLFDNTLFHNGSNSFLMGETIPRATAIATI